MTPWKKVLIIANCIIALGVLVFLGLLGELYYDSHYGPRDGFSASGEVDAPIYIRYFNDRTCRLYDYNKGEYITPKWEWISTGVTEDSLVVFCDKNRQRGFVNVYTGKVVIPAQYKHAWNFSEGKAAVYKDGKVWFVNKQNQPIIPTKYTPGEYSAIRMGFAFHNGYSLMCDSANRCGIIDTTGAWVIPPTYDCIWSPNKAGIRIVQNEHKYGLMTLDGQIILPIIYNFIEMDAADNFLVTKDGIMAKHNPKGELIDPFVCTDIETVYYSDINTVEGEYTTYKRYYIYNKQGIIDTHGNLVIPALYHEITQVTNILFAVQEIKDGPWTLIDISTTKSPK